MVLYKKGGFSHGHQEDLYWQVPGSLAADGRSVTIISYLTLSSSTSLATSSTYLPEAVDNTPVQSIHHKDLLLINSENLLPLPPPRAPNYGSERVRTLRTDHVLAKIVLRVTIRDPAWSYAGRSTGQRSVRGKFEPWSWYQSQIGKKG